MAVPILAVELGCLAVIACFAWGWRRRLRDRAFQGELLFVAAAAWIAEDTCIRAYGFYEYHAPWHLFLDRVPLLIALIWPLVILSARSLARALRPDAGAAGLAACTAALVLADAAFIEPIAVQAGLWRWTRPGPFDVPVIGVLGWALFAATMVWLLEWRRRHGGAGAILAVAIAPVATHLLLLAAWWGAFRLLAVPEAVAAGALLWSGAAGWAGSRGGRIDRAMLRRELPARVPAATFFGWLLWIGTPSPALLAWAAAVAVAWMTFAGSAFRSEGGLALRGGAGEP